METSRSIRQPTRHEATRGRRRNLNLGFVHRLDDDREPNADAGDELRSHERRVAAAERHGERAGHEEEVGEYQRGAAAQRGGEDGHEHVHVHGAGSSTAQAIGGESAREKEGGAITRTSPFRHRSSAPK